MMGDLFLHVKVEVIPGHAGIRHRDHLKAIQAFLYKDRLNENFFNKAHLKEDSLNESFFNMPVLTRPYFSSWA